jgi:hypothetical protein
MATQRQHRIASEFASEPSVAKLIPGNDNYTTELIRLNNWYSYEKTRKDAYKYHIDYSKKFRNADLKYLSLVDERDVDTTLCWMSRIKMRDIMFSDAHEATLNEYYDKLVLKGKAIFEQKNKQTKVAAVAAAPTKTIQEALQEKISDFLGDMEGHIDDFIAAGFKTDFSLYNHLKFQHLAPQYATAAKELMSKKLEELNDIPNDKQLQEGYAYLGKRGLNAYIKLLTSFVEDSDKYLVFKKANRKPRVVKEKPAGVQVKSIKYKANDTELGIKSEVPSSMIGAEQVWLFNTKNRKLSVYVSESTKGLQAKGTALQSWSPEKSKQKTLRKPAEQIKEMLACGKVKLRTFMDTIKSKEQAVNGRLNEDTIILKVIK